MCVRRRKMAAYFDGSTSSEIESSSAEGLQTLYLMNPNYVVPPYSHAPTNILSAAAPAHALNLANFSHAPPPNTHHHQQHLLGFTVPSSNIIGSTTGNSTQLGQHEIRNFHSFAAPRSFAATAAVAMAANPRAAQYNLWGSVINQNMSSVTTAAAETSNSKYSAAVTVADDSVNIIGYDDNRGHHRSGSLSLSLSSQHPAFRPLSGGEIDLLTSRGAGGNGVLPGMQLGVVLGSKYLKAAHEVLDEAVNVGKGICQGKSKEGGNKNNKEKMIANIETATNSGENSGSKQGAEAELSTAQRQELQMKKSKLVNMLDEVELRYRQYHNQMEMMISSFEQAAGYGAAKSYTTLALKTISKQFRCLKDAISSQIKTTKKTLGEDDCLGAKVEGSRLRYVDHHLRQQRALQQLGMMQHNAWRPQRGLPERAVTILRAWLFEHFLHPYPKDSDKVMLAKQTGLTRSQVSNWFINARVRLWKPMVEEMYLEEIKEQDQINNVNNHNTKTTHESSAHAITLDHHHINALHSQPERFNQNTSPTDEISNSDDNNSLSTSPIGGGVSFQSHSGFHLAESSSEIQIRSPKKPRTSEVKLQHCPAAGSMDMEIKPSSGDKTREANYKKFESKDGYPLMINGDENHGGGGYGGPLFSMEDIGRFNVTDQLAPRFHGNGVSLTLGLPHNENLPLSATHQHGFLPQNMHLGGRIEMGTNENEFCGINTNPPSSHSGTGYENIDIQNRKRFAAQLLRNFVA